MRLEDWKIGRLKVWTIAWQQERQDWPFRLPRLTIGAEKTALLVVDMSNQDQRNVTRALPNTVRLLGFFRQAGLPVIYLLVGSLLPDARDQHVKRRLTWMRLAGGPPYLCPKGSWEYMVKAELKPLPSEPVLDKNTQGAFNSSILDSYLRALEVQNLVVAGIATSHCVESTARDAADRGYNVILVEDACSDRDEARHCLTMETFGKIFGSVTSTDDVIATMSHLLETPAIL